MATQAVQKRPSTAKKECIGAPKVQSPRQRGLETHTPRAEPACQLSRLFQCEACQLTIGYAARHPHQIVEIFLKTIGIRQHVCRRLMHGTKVTRVPRIAAAHVARGRLNDKNRAA